MTFNSMVYYPIMCSISFILGYIIGATMDVLLLKLSTDTHFNKKYVYILLLVSQLIINAMLSCVMIGTFYNIHLHNDYNKIYQNIEVSFWFSGLFASQVFRNSMITKLQNVYTPLTHLHKLIKK
jgi:hypothetical protein